MTKPVIPDKKEAVKDDAGKFDEALEEPPDSLKDPLRQEVHWI